LQAMPLQVYGTHDCIVAGLHVPAPSQTRPSVWAVAFTGQAGAAHEVPAAKTSQTPFPSQNPVCPQVAAPAFTHELVGSVPPLGTGAHVPAVAASAHDRQVPVQAVRQQTPCEQKVLLHSVPSAQVAPGALSPQVPFVHTAGGSQSALAEQAARQAEAPHRNGEHELAAGVTQAPAPSHVEAGVNVAVPARQLAAPQGVPCGNF
jgi:hypothetical protein